MVHVLFTNTTALFTQLLIAGPEVSNEKRPVQYERFGHSREHVVINQVAEFSDSSLPIEVVSALMLSQLAVLPDGARRDHLTDVVKVP